MQVGWNMQFQNLVLQSWNSLTPSGNNVFISPSRLCRSGRKLWLGSKNFCYLGRLIVKIHKSAKFKTTSFVASPGYLSFKWWIQLLFKAGQKIFSLGQTGYCIWQSVTLGPETRQANWQRGAGWPYPFRRLKGPSNISVRVLSANSFEADCKYCHRKAMIPQFSNLSGANIIAFYWNHLNTFCLTLELWAAVLANRKILSLYCSGYIFVKSCGFAPSYISFCRKKGGSFLQPTWNSNCSDVNQVVIIFVRKKWSFSLSFLPVIIQSCFSPSIICPNSHFDGNWKFRCGRFIPY